MSLSKPQIKLLFSAIREAAENVGEKPEEYRKRVMKEELGVEHLAEVTKTVGFDKLMQRVLADSGRFEAAMNYVGADINRLRFVLLRAATRVLMNMGREANESEVYKYVAGIMTQMRISYQDRDSLWFKLQRKDGFDDFSPYQLKKVIAALQTHIRRHS